MCSTARQQLVDDDNAAEHASRFCANFLRHHLTKGPDTDTLIRETADMVIELVRDTIRPQRIVRVETALHHRHVQITVASDEPGAVTAEIRAERAAVGARTRGNAWALEAVEAPRFLILPVPRAAAGAMRCNVSALL